jgi:glutamate racemase
MHILITDSGVGGLSVCAYAERFVRTHGVAEPVRLTFANAAPSNDAGYNAMPTREEKLRTFERFLHRVTERFVPDSIYVACNTLSVLLPDTPYAASAPIPVRGIVETGAALLAEALAAEPRSNALIFGTQTTIDAGAYPRLLTARGVDPSRIVSQACPGLADVISEDRQGGRTAAEIRRWVGAALAKRRNAGAPAIAYLACTHYGYRADLFSAALDEAGVHATVIDPNERAVDDLFDTRAQSPGNALVRDVEVEFVTRYAIPPATVETLTFFLGDIAPATVAAMRRFIHVPDLF